MTRPDEIARLAQHIERDEYRPHPERRGAEGGTIILWAIIQIAALFGALLYAAWRVW